MSILSPRTSAITPAAAPRTMSSELSTLMDNKPAVTPSGRFKLSQSKIHSGMSKSEFNTVVLRKPIRHWGYQNKLGKKIEATVDLIGLDEFGKIHFYRQLLSECFGTFILMWLGCGVVTGWRADGHPSALSMASIILGWGFTISSLVWSIANVSGCLINPAVTIAMFVNRRIPLVRCMGFIGVQVLGAVFGAYYHKYCRAKVQATCETLLNREMGIDEMRGFLTEFGITFFLCFVVFATIDPNRKDHGGSHAIVVGGAIMPLVNVAAEMTGAGMNPARSFGPALVSGNWDAHWIYWVAPILGGSLGGLFYDLIFSERMVAWHRFLNVGETEDDESDDELDME